MGSDLPKAEDNQGRETDNNNDNDHDLDGVSNRNDDSTSGFVSMPPGQESLDNTPNIAIIAGSVAGVVFLACVLSGFVLLHKRQSQKRPMVSETYFDRKIETHPMSSSGGRSNSDGGSGSFNSGSSGESKSGTILEKTQSESQPNKSETQERWSVAPLSSTMPALIPPEHAHFKYHLTNRHQGPENLYSMEEEDFEILASYSPEYYDPSRFYPFTPRRINSLLPLAEEETLEVVSEPDSPIITADSFPVPPSTPVLHSRATLSPPRARNNSTSNSRQGDLVNNDGAFKVRLGSRGSRALLRNDPDLRTTFQPPLSMMSEPLTLSRSPSASSVVDAMDEATKKRVSVYDGDGQRLQAKRAGSLLFK
ncbi:hypothetical protein MVEG_11651 [Podila verticillata NRRL 6337]|uniref:Uncharacterized protein n=1 Tax=Podila verticillata NRRL 6337 TaxID=1069443 RepID=A0A086TKG5_9FUNG|nr:hypothetical protein MVEG_11651 [Podila verticillata NRRL 6337]